MIRLSVIASHKYSQRTHLVDEENARSTDRCRRRVFERVDLEDHAHCRRQGDPLVRNQCQYLP